MGWPYRAGFLLTGFWCLVSLLFRCEVHSCGWVLLLLSQKLVIGACHPWSSLFSQTICKDSMRHRLTICFWLIKTENNYVYPQSLKYVNYNLNELMLCICMCILDKILKREMYWIYYFQISEFEKQIRKNHVLIFIW